MQRTWLKLMKVYNLVALKILAESYLLQLTLVSSCLNNNLTYKSYFIINNHLVYDSEVPLERA